VGSNKDKNLRKEIGLKLKVAREKLGLTQAQVAEKAKLNVNYYAQIERGEVNTTFEKLESIMKALGIKSLI
jgi:transcriptional regulator with XRE-family HTH domain